MLETGTLISSNTKIGRAELAQVPTPEATATHRPIPHHEIVEALVETLSFRQIGVVNEEYAVSSDGMKMFGVLDLATGFDGCRFSIGIRNSHDKSFGSPPLSACAFWCARTWRSPGTSRLCWPSTQRTSRCRTVSPSAWIACSETSNPCGARLSSGEGQQSLRPPRS